MPELRKEPIIGRWVIINTNRGKSPADLEVPEEPARGGFCPFCPGNEGYTPGEVLAFRKEGTAPNGPGWRLRVIPNKFPALMVEGDLNREGEGLYDRMNGVGAHEVIIESPDHAASLGTLEPAAVEEVLWAFRERMVDLKRDRRLKYVLIFKNHGEAAGSSVPHTHSQLIALPIVPRTVHEELEGARTYFQYKDRCIFCDIVKQEVGARVRVVEESAGFVVLAPFASRSPFETWILPKVHACAYEEGSRAIFSELAQVFARTMRRLDRALRRPPYNFMLHTAPLHPPRAGDAMPEYFHWHFEILPKLSKIAGFEWGSGFYINPTPPEDAARYLRELEV